MNFVAGSCAASDRAAALAILYQHLAEFDRNQQIERMLSPGESIENSVKLEGLLSCKSAAGVVGAMLCIESPGRVLMAWPPKSLGAASRTAKESIYVDLLQSSVRFAAAKRCRFIQLLADDVATELERPLHLAGYTHLTRLLYVRRQISPNERVPPPPSHLDFVPYRDDLRDQLTAILHDSYRGSLDCPELNGVRSMDDIFASHKGQGTFAPHHWYLVKSQGKWVGCLLLTAVNIEATLELTYIAVTPEERGKGLGVELTRQAIRHALQHDFDAIVLAVDSRNDPALVMYESEQFLPWDVKEIYLLVLDPAATSASAGSSFDG